MKSAIKLLTAVSLLSLGLTSNSYARHKQNTDDYESNYYAAEGSIMLKVRGSGIFGKSKAKSFPEPTTNPAKPADHFFTNGYGLTGASTVFFTDNIALELAAGIYVLRTSNSALQNANYNYGNLGTQMKRKNVYGIPLDIVMQYHIAPFGAIRPYLGAGYNGTYMYAQSNQFKIGHTHGPVFQAGVDFVMNDDSVINIDIKHYNWSPKLTYTESFLGRRGPVSGKAKFQPVVISLGFGLKF